MLKTKVICDICHNVITEEPDSDEIYQIKLDIKNKSLNMYFSWDNSTILWGNSLEYDLCNDCANKLSKKIKAMSTVRFV